MAPSLRSVSGAHCWHSCSRRTQSTSSVVYPNSRNLDWMLRLECKWQIVLVNNERRTTRTAGRWGTVYSPHATKKNRCTTVSFILGLYWVRFQHYSKRYNRQKPTSRMEVNISARWALKSLSARSAFGRREWILLWYSSSFGNMV